MGWGGEEVEKRRVEEGMGSRGCLRGRLFQRENEKKTKKTTTRFNDCLIKDNALGWQFDIVSTP